MLKRSMLAAGALLLSANLHAQTDIRQGLVAYWPLDEAVDTFGAYTTPELVSGLDFELVNMDPSNVVEGRRGPGALLFNGTDELAIRYNDLTLDTGLPISRARAFTVTYWVKATLPRANDRRMFSEGNSVPGSINNNRNPLFNLGTHSSAAATSGVLDVFIRNDGGTTLQNHVRTVAQPLDGEWHHIAYVDNFGQVAVYIDGVQDPTNFNYTRGTLTVNTTTLGAIQRDFTGSWFAGTIDDVALWERPLSAAEVQQLINNGIQTPITPQPALVMLQPAPARTNLGHRVTFSASAVGTRPLEYQWFRGETPVEGATSPTLTINNVLASDAGQYRLRVTNPAGPVFSDPAELTVDPDPAPDVRAGLQSYWPLNSGAPQTPDLYSGNNFQLVNMDESNYVAGQRGQALMFDGIEEYAFRAAGSPISQNANFSVSFWVKANNLGQVDRRVFAEASTTTQATLFNLGTPSNGVGQGLDVYIRNDANTVLVDHRRSQRPVFDDAWHHITWVDANGAARLYIDGVLDPTNFAYTRSALTPNTTSLAGILRSGPSALLACQIDEVAVWSRAITYTELLEVFNTGVPEPVAIIPPSITIHPAGADLYQGDRIVLTADATGTAPLTLQWLKNGQPIPGATGRTLLLSNVQPGDSGTYTFRASNASPEVATSNPAEISVTAVTGLNTALVSYWPLDVLTTTTPDVINGNDLTAYNLTEANLVEGKVGMAVSFPASAANNEILGRNHAATPSIGLPISDHRSFTVTLWVNGVDPTGEQDRRVFGEGSSVSNNPLFNIGTDSANNTTTSLPWLDILIRNANNTTLVNHRKSTLPVFDGVWRHIAYVDNYGTVSIYIDGVLEPATDFNYVRSLINANTTAIGGILRANPLATFTGLIDEVAVWSRALSEVEVLNVLVNGPTGGAGGSIEISNISLSGANLRIAVSTTQDSANLRVQSIETVDASNWTDVSGVTWDIVNNQPVATFAAPASARFYRVVGTQPPPPPAASVVFFDNLESGATGWTHGGELDSWELGMPVNGPGLAYSGNNAFGTDLDAPYAANTIQYLRSPAIDLTGVTSGRIAWYEFRDIETGDLAEVLIKDADNPDVLLAALTSNTGTRSSWNRRSFVIPAEALGRRIIVEFLLSTDATNTLPRPGWFIDDLQVIRN